MTNAADQTTAAPAAAPTSSRLSAFMALVGGKDALALALVLVLDSFLRSATLLLVTAFGLTQETIEKSTLENLRRFLAQVIPASLYNNPAADTLHLTLNGQPVLVYRARRDGRITGVAFQYGGAATVAPSACCWRGQQRQTAGRACAAAQRDARAGRQNRSVPL